MQQYFGVFKNEKLIKLNEIDYHHIKDVMRLKSGDQILVAFENKIYKCSLRYVNDGFYGEIIEEDLSSIELKKRLTLIYGMPRNEKFEMIIQKACELGVSRIIPFICERSIIKIDNSKVSSKMERWNKIAKEACEQSHRSTIPLIERPILIKDLHLYLSDINVCGNENLKDNGTKELFEFLDSNLELNKSFSILIGPEGGFSTSEFDFFKKIGFKDFSFGHRILRSETAVIYILSIFAFMIERRGVNDGK
ncbi:MAG: RsmE family RNA methyltransferase [Bacilli bacterium]|nr:RsmE family RNA methyltransferase [Bacilli bacterium]